MWTEELILLWFVVVPMAYFLPALDAYWRRHPQRGAIALLNLLGGWTVVGWIVAAVWSAVRSKDAVQPERRVGLLVPGLGVVVVSSLLLAVILHNGFRDALQKAETPTVTDHRAAKASAATAPLPVAAPKTKSLRAGTYQPPTAWVERVIDGDTFVLNSGERIRIFGIDTPELKEGGGDAARNFLLGLIDGREVRLDRRAKDRYGRSLAYVFLMDGQSVGRLLLDAKLATPYLGEKVKE